MKLRHQHLCTSLEVQGCQKLTGRTTLKPRLHFSITPIRWLTSATVDEMKGRLPEVDMIGKQVRNLLINMSNTAQQSIMDARQLYERNKSKIIQNKTFTKK